MIRIKDLSFSFMDKKVFEHLNVEFKDNTITSLMGSSGVGKTTLFNIVAGLLTPDSGSITGNENGVVYMFQENRLIDSLTASENVALAVSPFAGRKKLLADGRDEYVAHLLRELMLEDAKDLYPHELSGGMQRRIALARAAALCDNKRFASSPVLLDEPFKGLDNDSRSVAFDFVKKHFADRTVVIITHDESDALLCGENVTLYPTSNITI